MNSSINSKTESPFHAGEQLIQQQLGVREKMERFGSRVIRDHMPEQHQEFYAQLPFVFVAHADKEGWPWASMLFNPPGFIQSTDNRTLRINAQPVAGDPLADEMTSGTRLGLLGIELSSRRRNRMSGRIKRVTANSFELIVDQTFGNCPQYIQSREPIYINPGSQPDPAKTELDRLDQQAKTLIADSDTFFVASYVNNGSGQASEGADLSHRGGKPGFVRVDNDTTLTIPDYLGNNHFNTLGNFVENAQAGLLFIDFTNGHLLTLTGTVEILWNSPDVQYFTGAERLWRFHIDHGRWLKNALPFRWSQPKYSPNTLLTGSWPEQQAARNADILRNSWQSYTVVNIINENLFIKSFYLQPPANQKPIFEAGQFLTLKATIQGKETIRTYTVSSAPSDPLLRISVKHESASDEHPAGVFSSYLHQQIEIGSVIAVKAPTGSFVFNANKPSPLVLLSAGIGITPMLAIARHALLESVRTRNQVSIIFISSARNANERAFFDELNELAKNSNNQLRIFWALSQPEPNLQIGGDFQHHGRIDKDCLQSLLPATVCNVYLCGPGGFMQSQYDNLRLLGIPDQNIYAEAFGPSSLQRDISPSVIDANQQAATEAIVNFARSGVEQAWSTADGNLLEFAEAHGLTPAYGCRSGQCGACKVRLIAGKVVYPTKINTPANADEVILCCAVPAHTEANEDTHMELDL